jgi:carbamoyltransferase
MCIRDRKFSGVTDEVIDYILEASNVKFEEIDCIATSGYIKDGANNTLILEGYDDPVRPTIGNDTKTETGKMRGRDIPVITISHHLAHCASAFYTSNYDKSWCLSMDSSFGLIECNSLVAFGDGNKLHAITHPNLIAGIGYCIFTEKLGLGSGLHKAGTTMGLASYGKPCKKLTDNINEYVNQMHWNVDQQLIDKVEYLEGWSYMQNQYYNYWDNVWNELVEKPKNSFKQYAEIAASIQHLMEESLLSTVKQIKKIPVEFNSDNICLSGGSLLNCGSNTKIKTKGPFNNVHHFPACGDDGICVGAALYVAHHMNDEPRYNYEMHEIMYLGKKYEYEEPDYYTIASMLRNGKIIGWFMGASEYGPRALGHRSILADPTTYHNRELINFAVKNREWFRPFAPVVLEEKAFKWFEFDGPSPLMLYTVPVLQPEKVPAVTHVDGTARHQTVNENDNKEYYRLIKEFDRQTGVPILINTSFNGKDEPIVETVEDAMKAFNNSDLDAVVINGKLILK